MNKIIITKKIAKQGRNNIIVIPSYLKEAVKAGSIVKVEITLLDILEKPNKAHENGKHASN